MIGQRPAVGGFLRRVGRVVRVAGSRRDSGAIIVSTGLAYALVYLFAIGNLSIQPGIGRNLVIVADPWTRMFDPGPGWFAYEPIAIVDLWAVRYLLSPVNTSISLAVGVLVGINMGLVYLAIRQPRACRIGTASGVFASVPALLAGGACCAPLLLIVLGITAGGTLITLIGWLLPIGVVLLVISLSYLANHIDPTWVAGDGAWT